MKLRAVAEGRGFSPAEAVAVARQRIFDMVKDAGSVDSVRQSTEITIDTEIDGEPYQYAVTLQAELNLPDALHNPYDVRCVKRVHGEATGRDAICMVCRPSSLAGG